MKQYEIENEDYEFMVAEATGVPYGSTAKLPPRKLPRRRGVVSDLVNPVLRPQRLPTSMLLNAIQEGLPVSELEALQNSLNIPMEKLMDILGIAKSTLHRRRKGDQRLDTLQSDRIIRYARLLSKAVDVFESVETARQWLKVPQFGLGGATPLNYARTELGAREVEDLLGRIDHSVYS